MSFEEYCLTKKIDVNRFKVEDAALYREWEAYFAQVSPDSFTQQKKFLINPVRLRFSLLKK